MRQAELGAQITVYLGAKALFVIRHLRREEWDPKAERRASGLRGRILERTPPVRGYEYDLYVKLTDKSSCVEQKGDASPAHDMGVG